MTDITHKTRVWLIQIGKVIPFVICGVVLISYLECGYAFIEEDFVSYGDYYVLNKPISWFIGNYFEYNLQMLFVITIISFAIRACIYNKLAIIYLALNLYEKSFFATHEYEYHVYYSVIAINIIVSSFFVYRGLKILIKKQ